MSTALLEVRSLGVDYGRKRVLENVSFEVAAGESVGLVGESGAGKSTIARAILKLAPVREGEIRFDSVELRRIGGHALRRVRRGLQMIFQDPVGSLDPRLSIAETLLEALEVFETGRSREQRRARIREALERVGLDEQTARRLPGELSGGECQRAAIARALLPQPKLLICDEPVSALDVSIQGQILNLLADLNRREGTALLLISHNLLMVRHLCRRIIVLAAGRVLEVARAEQLFGGAMHPFSRELLAAIPALDRRTPVVARAAAPSAAAPPAFSTSPRPTPVDGGCVYQQRCKHAVARCRQQAPELEAVGDEHLIACHRWREIGGEAP
jgi:oligopeptide transport system ATP-binding protein